jgi:hypothetical protein
MKVTLSEIYRCILDEEALALLQEFPRMVDWWIGKARGLVESGTRVPIRYSEFRNMYYHEWTREFSGWNTLLAQTSSLLAYTEIGLRRPWLAKKDLKVKARFAVIYPNIAWIRNGCLRISTKPRIFSYVKLMPKDERQEFLLKQAETKVWRVGQVLLTKEWALIPLLKEAKLLESIDPAIVEIAHIG